MFNSLDEVLVLSTIFTKSLTIAPQQPSGGDLAGPSSLALIVGGLEAGPLNIPPLQAHPPIPYDDLEWETNKILVNEC